MFRPQLGHHQVTSRLYNRGKTRLDYGSRKQPRPLTRWLNDNRITANNSSATGLHTPKNWYYPLKTAQQMAADDLPRPEWF